MLPRLALALVALTGCSDAGEGAILPGRPRCIVNADICDTSGTSGCSSVAACTSKTFDGTTPVCEPA